MYVITPMYAINFQQQANMLGNALRSLQLEVHHLKEKITEVSGGEQASTTTPGSSKSVDVSHFETQIEDVKKTLSKWQTELLSMINGLKRDTEVIKETDVKKELILMEASLTHKLESIVNKIVKERLDMYSTEMREEMDALIDEKLSALMNTDADEQDLQA
jgi:hypothetical protein